MRLGKLANGRIRHACGKLRVQVIREAWHVRKKLVYKRL
jgi:hypothetical protein